VRLTSFVGRQADLAELLRLIGASRLVTIVGGAGLGKTRLAVEVAGRLVDGARTGVRFVSLAALTDGALVPQEVASSLDVAERAGEPLLRTLVARIGAREMLLVLDNCEHLVDASASLVEALLRGCPNLRVLATGRQPLRVAGERVWRIAPLAVPEAGDDDPRTVAASEAVGLFAARARLADPSFGVGPGNAAVIALVCRRLEGIPLAIELAAASLETTSLDGVLSRLEDRLRLLAAGDPSTVPRHRTLQAALDWDHQLLDDQQRRLFRRVSVFHGGFDLAAAEAVCGAGGLRTEEVVELVVRLAERSLLVPDTSRAGPTRYHLLQTVREYGAERLAESGERASVARAHAAHFTALAERAERHERGPEHVEWLERLEADHDNLRAALAWSRGHDVSAWQRLASSLVWFWVTRGHSSQGRGWLEGALAAAPGDTPARAGALLALGRLSFWQGDYESARSLCGECLEVCRRRGDSLNRSWALTLLGSVDAYQGRYLESRRRLEEVLAAVPGQDVRMEALVALGEVLLQAGDLASARARLDEVRALARGPEAPRGRAALFRGLVAILEADRPTALHCCTDSLDIFHRLRNRYAAGASLDGLAALAVADGDPVRALRLSGAAAALRDSTGAQLAPHWRDVVRTAIVEPAMEAAGKRAAAAWAEGRRMDLDQAVRAARAGLPAPLAASSKATGRPRRPDGLSARELEVARLVAQGLTNREIAERLVIAERTAEGHVERIRKKLNVRSRREVALSMVARSV
jgi:non-specific serine/threonine protein kinase